MQRLASQFHEMPVFAAHSGTVLGNIQSFVVNPDSLKTVALTVQTSKKAPLLYLLPSDIRHLDTSKVIINSDTALSKADELVRFKQLIEKPFELTNTNVVTQNGKKLGRVKDFTVTIEDFLITKLYLKSRSIWQIFYNSHIIDRSAIVDVKDQKTIVVKDSTIKLQKNSASVLPAKS